MQGLIEPYRSSWVTKYKVLVRLKTKKRFQHF